ncbi:MAG: (2Fe-2S)-binding protein [Bacteroidota bacterium]
MEDIICKCHAVSKEEILYAIRRQNAKNIGDIQRITAASTGCGRCGVIIKRILEEELSLNNIKTDE